MKKLVSVFLFLFSINSYSDYIRTGQVETDQGFKIGIFTKIGFSDYKPVNYWIYKGKKYNFPTRFKDYEIDEVVNNGKMCYSEIFSLRVLYFNEKKLGRFPDVRFKCRYVP